MRQKPNKEKALMLLSELLGQYREYMQTAKPLSRPTILNYLCRVGRYVESLGTSATLADMTRASIIRYVNRVGTTSARAVRMHYAAIRHFCRWLLSEQWIRQSPADNIPLPKVTSRRRDTVPDDVIVRLMDACDKLPRSPYRQALAKAALSLLVYGGLRRGEALALRIEDVRMDTGEIFIRSGKGSKSRSVYVPKECIEAVKALLKVRMECTHDLILAHNKRYGMKGHGLASLLNDLHTVAGVEEHYTPHQLRHAYATRLAANGAPLPAIQAALGHSRLETTAIYLHSNDEQLKALAHLASLSHQPETRRVETPKTAAPSGEREKARRFSVRRLR